jgi:hypothetical protein
MAREIARTSPSRTLAAHSAIAGVIEQRTPASWKWCFCSEALESKHQRRAVKAACFYYFVSKDIGQERSG